MFLLEAAGEHLYLMQYALICSDLQLILAPMGLAGLFSNPTYGTIFSPFSPLRLFTPVGSNLTDVWFFVPAHRDGPRHGQGFGAVFTDVDAPDGLTPAWGQHAAGVLRHDGQLLFSGVVPASPGDGTSLLRHRVCRGAHRRRPDHHRYRRPSAR